MGKEVCISEPSHDGREEEGNDGHGGDAGVMRGNWRRKKKTELIFADMYVHFSQVFICTVNKESKNPVVVKSVATF